jgi:hypothetical protein
VGNKGGNTGSSGGNVWISSDDINAAKVAPDGMGLKEELKTQAGTITQTAPNGNL